MIELESVRIEEFRGIRDLSLPFRGHNFAICGNNGTGKSGVVDALEFALTGRISRLAGEGSGNVSVREHGPHVDARDAPEKAKVTLELSYSDDGAASRKMLITRHLKTPNRPVISPKDAAGIAALKGIEAHPELVLSRRQLIRYVLTSPAERSKQVQALLRLDHLIYSSTCDTVLTGIYGAVREEFESLYRSIHHHDENDFTAQLVPSTGALDLKVDSILR